LFHPLFLVHRFDSHVKYTSYPSFTGGHWVHEIFSPDVPGFIFQIRLRSTWTDAAAHCPFLLALPPSAASILNSLGGEGFRALHNQELPSPRLLSYMQDVESATMKAVTIAPYPDATPNDNIGASLELGPDISKIMIQFRPLRPISDPITEKSVAHELTHALMIYAQGYQIPCAPKDVSTYSVQTAAEIVDMVDDVIVDSIIHRRGFVIDAPEQMKSAERNLRVFELATNRNQIDPYEPDPIRAEVNSVSMFIHAWALPRYVKLRPQAYEVYKKLVRRFPQIMKTEFKKAQALKKTFIMNDIFTLQGRTQVAISALELWPIDERIYLAPLSAA
jgi:hypothetical protein